MSDTLTPEEIEEGLWLDAARTPGQWRACQGSTHLELRAPHQTGRSVARVYCDIDAAFVAHAADHYGTALRHLKDQAAELGRLTGLAAELRHELRESCIRAVQAEAQRDAARAAGLTKEEGR